MEKQIRINGLIPGHPQGSVVTVQCDDEGTPLEFFWRRQLKSAKLDGCCEFIEVKQRSVYKKKITDKENDK